MASLMYEVARKPKECHLKKLAVGNVIWVL